MKSNPTTTSVCQNFIMFGNLAASDNLTSLPEIEYLQTEKFKYLCKVMRLLEEDLYGLYLNFLLILNTSQAISPY